MDTEDNFEEEFIFDDNIDDDFEFSDTNSEIDITENIETQNVYDNKIRSEMINKRSKIDRFHDLVKEKSEKYDKIKGEYDICKLHILELKKEESMTKAAIDTNKVTENIAAVFRLQGQLKRIELELEGEEDLLRLIDERLVESEQEKIKAQLMESSNAMDELELEDREVDYNNVNGAIGRIRVAKEGKLTQNTIKSFEFRRNATEQLANYEQAIFDNQMQQTNRAHRKHGKYLHKTIEENQKKLLEEEEINRNRQEKQNKSKQKLKSDMKQIKDNLSALRSKKLADEARQKAKDAELQQAVVEKGGNPQLELNRQKKILEIVQKEKCHSKTVKENQLKIADKLTQEEANMRKKKKLQPYLFSKSQTNLESNQINLTKSNQIESSLKMKDNTFINTEYEWCKWEMRSNAGESSLNDEDKKEEDEDNEVSMDNDEKKNDPEINQPEFEGLWDTSVVYKVNKDSSKLPIRNANASKMDQEIMVRVLNQLQENITQPQIVNGRVFKGRSFQSKPEIIKFENLEVGQTYTQKILLTNTSYSSNQCRFLKMSDNLLDFITVVFTPPGDLSPGMTCDFSITFQPQINEDIQGQLFFMAKTDKFSIGVECLTKKCKMSISRSVVQFETTIIGECLTESIVLKNSGAKGTYCYIDNSQNNHDVSNGEFQDDEERIVLSLGAEKLWIDGYAEQQVWIKWTPLIAGNYDKRFIINFEDEDNKGFNVEVRGTATDVPVYVDEPELVMDICMLDRLYQDAIVFNSRAGTALKLQFHVPESVRSYMEILPTTGFIQAGQNFKAQLKLLPTALLFTEDCGYFDKTTGVLQVPIKTTIAGQVKSVDLTVNAVITNTDLQLRSKADDGDSLDFDFCTIRETRIKQIVLINKSMLSQEFGFTGYPEYIEIQPNYGYGVILPNEELVFDVLFSPTKAEDYRFQIKCQTLINRHFQINGRGIGVHPSLDLSQQVVDMPTTSIGDVISTELFIDNCHVSTNIYTHEPPRIGPYEPVAAIGTKTFQFILPDVKENGDSRLPITVYPQSGSVHPGDKMKVTIFYEPILTSELIRKEAAELVTNKCQEAANMKWEEEVVKLEEELLAQQRAEPTPDGAKHKKSAKKSTKSATIDKKDENTLEELKAAGPETIEPTDPASIGLNSDEFMKGQLSLINKYRFNLEVFKLTCVIAEGDINDGVDKLNYNIHNTLYLELHCPSVRPDLVLLSNFGRHNIEFEPTILMKRTTQTLTVQNISSSSIQLTSPQLNPNGAFHVRNALRSIEPNGVSNILLSFEPKEEGLYQTEWTLSGEGGEKTLKLRFNGKAENAKIQLKEVVEDIFQCGKTLANEYLEKQLTIESQNDFPIPCSIILNSQSQFAHDTAQRNMTGLAVFDIVPKKFILEPGKPQSVTVTFAPDHESDRFCDWAVIRLFDDVEFYRFQLVGQSKLKLMYLSGLSQLDRTINDYLGEIWPVKLEENVPEPETQRLMLNLVAQNMEGEVAEVKSSFVVGCAKSLLASAKKSGEFTVDNINILTPLGFTIDPPKGQVEADSEKQVNVIWSPPSTYQIGSTISSSLSLTLKGDIATTYVIELRAFVE